MGLEGGSSDRGVVEQPDIKRDPITNNNIIILILFMDIQIFFQTINFVILKNIFRIFFPGNFSARNFLSPAQPDFSSHSKKNRTTLISHRYDRILPGPGPSTDLPKQGFFQFDRATPQTPICSAIQ
jgi:hypothetical protein